MMHKFNFLFCLMFFVALFQHSTQAQVFNNEKPMFPEGMKLQHSDSRNVTITFSLHSYEMKDLTVNDRQMKTLHIPGVFLPSEAGCPDLPTMSHYIAIPKGAKASYRISSKHIEVSENISVAPAPVIPKDTDKGPLQYTENYDIYNADSFYPASPVLLSAPEDMRGMDVVAVAITPFQYNPVTKELLTYTDMSVEINFEGGSGTFGEDRLRSIWWEPIYSQMLLNYSSLPKANFPKFDPRSKTPDFEYLIITPNNPDFLPWADTLKNWRTKQGIRTGVVTLSEIGGNDSVLIRNYLKTAYNTWAVPPVAVLFMADYGTGGATGTGIISPVYNNYCISDNIYADINQNHMPEISSARIVAQNAQQLQTIIGKILNYERNPPTLASYYQKPLIAGGWQTERWFILCTEVIYGYLKNVQNKIPTREYAIYTGTPGTSWSSNQNTSTVVNYFGPSGLNYIPSTPQHLTDWGGNASRINADINAGTFLVQHRDHGGEDGWGEPEYLNSNVTALNNTYPTFVFSMNCLTGKFNYSSNCFAEIFMRHSKGAFGMIAATEVSYSFVNDAYTWGVFDYMFPNFDPNYGQSTSMNMLPCFGNSSGKIYLKASSWPYNPQSKEVTYHLFHYHGDAFARINTEIPQPMTITHDTVIIPGKQSFCISAPAGALICISKDNQIVDRATSGGQQLCFFIGSPMAREIYTVTVTRQNSLRYSKDVPVMEGYIAMHVNYPNGGEMLRMGTVRNITWTSSTARKVKIEYTSNNGSNWSVVTDSTPAAPASFAWTVPGTLSSQCKVRITNIDSLGNSDVSDETFTITSQFCQDIPLSSYWNLLSVPVASASMAAASLFPTANSSIYSFENGYAPQTTLANGRGYWARFPEAITVPVCGEPISATSLPLAAGWNIIGPYGSQATIANCSTNPAGIINSSFFGYNNGYTLVTTLQPGKGYWVRTTQAGTLYLSGKTGESLSFEKVESNWIQITVTDALGNAKTLYIYPAGYASSQNSFALPPLPPAGIWDVRFSDDSYARSFDGNNIGFAVSGAVYPVKVKISGGDIVLQDKVSGGRLFAGRLNDGQEIVIANPSVSNVEIIKVSKVEQFGLDQNYPNPFNPSTLINYRLSAPGHTALKIFDAIGNEVAVLVNEVQSAGSHSVTWNASTHASGVYFYELVSGGNRIVKKLTLIK